MACPITKADLQTLRKAISLLREIDPDLEAAVKAEVPGVEEVAARNEHLRQALGKMLETYEPIVRRGGQE